MQGLRMNGDQCSLTVLVIVRTRLSIKPGLEHFLMTDRLTMVSEPAGSLRRDRGFGVESNLRPSPVLKRFV